MDWRDKIKDEYEEVRERFRGINFKSFQKGDWLASYVARILSSYAEHADVDRIYNKYRGDSPQQQAQHAIKLAAKRCSFAGGLTASLASAAEVSLIPTMGFSLPGVGAAVGLAVMTDIGFCLRTHIRTTYDLSILYGGPLAADDVEDCYLIFMHAMQIRVEDIAGKFAKFLTTPQPELVTYNARMIMRTGIRAFFQEITYRGGGNTLIRKLVERVNMRLLVPGVNIAIAGNFNQRFTRHVLGIAERRMHLRGAIVQPLIDLYDREPYLDPSWVIVAIIIVVESAAAAEWSRHQLETLRCCQSILRLSDDDLAELDAWFDCDAEDFACELPPIRHDAATYYIDFLITVAALTNDVRFAIPYAKAIARIAHALDIPLSARNIAQRIQTQHSEY